MGFAQFVDALEDDLRIGLGSAEALAGAGGAAHDAGGERGDVRREGLGAALALGIAVGESGQLLVVFLQLQVHRLGHRQGDGGHHAVGLDLQQAADHPAKAVRIQVAIDQQDAVDAVLGEAEVRPGDGIAAPQGGPGRVLEAIGCGVARPVRVRFHQHLVGIDQQIAVIAHQAFQRLRQRRPERVAGGPRHHQGEGEELGMAFPLQGVFAHAQQALGTIAGQLRVGGLVEAFHQGVADNVLGIGKGEVVDVGRITEVDRRPRVQLVVQRFAKWMHGTSVGREVFFDDAVRPGGGHTCAAGKLKCHRPVGTDSPSGRWRRGVADGPPKNAPGPFEP
ncbi:hypothetical protein D9M70_459230 [compost metagenome]